MSCRKGITIQCERCHTGEVLSPETAETRQEARNHMRVSRNWTTGVDPPNYEMVHHQPGEADYCPRCAPFFEAGLASHATRCNCDRCKKVREEMRR